MKKKNIIIAGAAALVALTAVAGITVRGILADTNSMSNTNTICNHQGNKFGMGFNMTTKERDAWRAQKNERQKAVESALEANDYNAWKKAVGDNAPMLSKINKDNFSKLIEAHKDMEAARKIFSSLGIERGEFGHGHRGMRSFTANTNK